MGQLIYNGPFPEIAVPGYGKIVQGGVLTAPTDICNELYGQNPNWWTPTGGFVPSPPPTPAAATPMTQFAGDWSSSYTYSQGMVSIDVGQTWVCTVTNSGQRPSTTTGYWRVTQSSSVVRGNVAGSGGGAEPTDTTQVPHPDGSGGWAWGAGGGGGGGAATLRTITAATTIVSGDAGNVIELDATSAAFSQALPDATTYAGRVTLVATTTGTNVVTLTTTGGQTIDPPGVAAVSTLALGTQASGSPYQAVDLIPDGANWRIV